MQSTLKPDTPALLLLADGTLFKGHAVGKVGTVSGELCFNTGMTGYQEIFSDPSYFGQLMLMTNVHIGNYGIEKDEFESDAYQISGLICRNFSHNFSRPRADKSLKDDFIQKNVVGIAGIDTRALVAHIRSKGSMNAVLSSEIRDVAELAGLLNKVPSMEGLELSSMVSTKEPYFFGNPDGTRIAVLDFGVKKNILRCFDREGFYMKVFPWDASQADLMDFQPSGVHLSNGPGDPGAMVKVVQNVSALISSGIPVFGICLGHQLIAEACGLKTYKMKNGHRGINHPVKNLITGKSEITSQNHGFAVTERDALSHPDLQVTHINLNDNTIEGLRHKHKPVFCVQYHPEAAPGPEDSRYLFSDFKQLIEAK